MKRKRFSEEQIIGILKEAEAGAAVRQRLLANARVVGYLAQCHPEILAEFQKVRELQKAA